MIESMFTPSFETVQDHRPPRTRCPTAARYPRALEGGFNKELIS